MSFAHLPNNLHHFYRPLSLDFLLLSIRGFTLEGAGLGLSFLFTPAWDKLLDMDVWKAAALQIIFSLGSCSGCNLSLASYNRFTHNCMRDAVLIALCNALTR